MQAEGVLQWISGHSPNPWPTCTVDSISYAISKIKQQWSHPPKPENQELSVDNRVMSVDFQPLLLRWDAKRHPNENVHLWRQFQITKYMDAFPEHKPRHVLQWISKQSPNPWPLCTAKAVFHVMSKIKKQWSCPPIKNNQEVSTDITVMAKNFLLKWDAEMPTTCNVHSWRRSQIRKFMETYPQHKPRHILKWIINQSPNP